MEKVPAHDLSAEQAVIGSMLLEAPAVQTSLNYLKPEDFYVEIHREIFGAIADMFANDGRGGIDIVTVGAYLKSAGKLDVVGGQAYLSECLQQVATAAHVEYYADIVKKASISRQIKVQFVKTYEKQTGENLRILGDLIGVYGTDRRDNILDLQKDIGKAIEELIDKKHKPLPTGFKKLDALISGGERGELWVIGARTSGGKTAMMTRLMCNMALAEIPALYITTEMTSYQMVGRILPMASGVPAWKFRQRALTKEDVKSVMDACADSLQPLPIKIYGRPRVGIDEIRSAIVRAKPSVIFVDYLQRCKLPKGDNRVYQIEEFMVELKTLTQEMNILTFLGAQLDRALDKNPGMAPTLADLRGSGAIEHEADGVMLLWKPPEEILKKRADYVPSSERPGMVHIDAVIAKGRNCAAGVSTPFELNGDLIKMSEKIVARHEEEGYREERWSPPAQ